MVFGLWRVVAYQLWFGKHLSLLQQLESIRIADSQFYPYSQVIASLWLGCTLVHHAASMRTVILLVIGQSIQSNQLSLDSIVPSVTVILFDICEALVGPSIICYHCI